MISYVKGPLVAIEENVIVVETGHVDLAIHVPVSLLPELPGMGKEVTVYTYFQVREDATTLYGFLHSQDRDMLRQLLEVNDIGSRGALEIPYMFRPDDLCLAIVGEDMKVLAKAPDIGNKMVRRLILDLKDRISMDDVLGNMVGGAGMDTVDIGTPVAGLVEAAREVAQALVALGYTSTGVFRVVKQVETTDGATSEDVLKVSLKYLSFL